MHKLTTATTVTAVGAVATAVGFASSAFTQENTVTKELTAGDRFVETEPTAPLNYEFLISVNSSTTSERAVHDTVPAEWTLLDEDGNVLGVNGANVLIIDGEGDDPTMDDMLPGDILIELANKKDRKGRTTKGDKKEIGESATKIWWIPSDEFDTGTVAIQLESRIRPQKQGRKRSREGDKFAPTSCGVYEINDGAMLFDMEPLIPELLAMSDPLCIVAVPDTDVDDDDAVDPNAPGVGGPGDGVGLFDEALQCTSPCDTDTDDDGVGDGEDACPTENHEGATFSDADGDGTPDVSESDEGLCDPDDPVPQL